MKFYVITLMLVLCQNQNVSCSFMDFVNGKFAEMGLINSWSKALQHVKQIMVTLFKPRITITAMTPTTSTIKALRRVHTEEVTYLPEIQPPPEIPVKQTFSHFVDSTAAEEDDFHSEYSSMKAEPTALMSTPQLALLHGRRIESHTITTKDGYILTIHRINPTSNMPHKFANKTVILHHGLLGSSADWILLGPQKSLPYILSDAGYDVWMVNARGNYYSRNHAWKKIDSTDYWKFSWQEMGEFDLPAIIDYIRTIKNHTNKATDKIDFIGHSMGATALLVLLSTSPQYNQFLRLGVLLAPLAYMTNVEGPLKTVTSMVTSPPKFLLKLIGTKEFVPSRKIPKKVAMKYCTGTAMFCCNPLYFIVGGVQSTYSWNASFIARVLYHLPAGGSTNTIVHYVQLVKNGKFHKFNDIYYDFNLSQISLPIALLSSDEDWVATIPDILRLYFSIANPIDHYIIRGKNFSHTDFVWGLNADDVVFNKVVDYLENGLNWFTTKSDIRKNVI